MHVPPTFHRPLLTLSVFALLGGTLAGCGGISTGAEVQEEQSQQAHADRPLGHALGAGEATLKLQRASRYRLPVASAGQAMPFPPAGYEFVVADTTTDEYLRSGESVTLAMAAGDLVGSNATDALLAVLGVDVEVTFYRSGFVFSTLSTSGGAFSAAPRGVDRVSKTPPFTIPAGADAVAFLLTARAPPAAPGQASFNGFQLRTVASVIIGAYPPNKLVLFDTNGSAKRQRILEGGALVAGARASLAYTDYRVATVLDASTLDLTVATVRDVVSRGGGLGPEHAVFGTVEYEVSVGTYDEVTGWTERVLEPALQNTVAASLLEPQGDAVRIAYSSFYDLPRAARSLQLYFHLKAFLVAPSFYSNAVHVNYPAGSRTLVRERYDNQRGPGTNYDFSLTGP
jgi:hypothetical protein